MKDAGLARASAVVGFVARGLNAAVDRVFLSIRQCHSRGGLAVPRTARGHTKARAPVRYPGPAKNWNGEGFLKPSRNNEALTTPSAYPRTGGLTSV